MGDPSGDFVGVDLLGSQPQRLRGQVGRLAQHAAEVMAPEIRRAGCLGVTHDRLAPYGVGEHRIALPVVRGDADRFAQHGLDPAPAVGPVDHRLGAQGEYHGVLGSQLECLVSRVKGLFGLLRVQVAVADLDPGAQVTGVFGKALRQQGPGLVIAFEIDEGPGLFDGRVQFSHSFRFFFR